MDPHIDPNGAPVSIAVISDIHANLPALEAVLAHADAQGAERIVCLGDVVGYNASPAACVDLLRAREGLVCLLGNHDAMASGLDDLRGINPMAHKAMSWTREQLDDDRRAWLAGLPLRHDDGPAVYVHASLHGTREWEYVRSPEAAARCLDALDGAVCFVGHSHIPGAWVRDADGVRAVSDDAVSVDPSGKLLVNVGSVGQPRDGDRRACYVIYDQKAGTVVRHRVEYDAAAACSAIIAAGLPEALADRLR